MKLNVSARPSAKPYQIARHAKNQATAENRKILGLGKKDWNMGGLDMNSVERNFGERCNTPTKTAGMLA